MSKETITNNTPDTNTLVGSTDEILNAIKPENVKDGVVDQVSRISEGFEILFLKLVNSIPKIVGAILVLIIGLFIIRTVLRIVRSRFEKRNVDLSLRGFLMSILKFVMYAILVLMVVQNLGLETTAILGALSGLVLAAGLALQGSLSNFAGGVLILLFRPFEVGDYIENNSGTEGTVEKIDLLYTTLVNNSGIKVFSPNGALANSVIRNFSKITRRRVEFAITISYADNIQEAQKAIETKLAADERVMKEPKPEILVKELSDSGVVLTVRAWAEKANFSSLNNSVQEEVKQAVYGNGFTNPFLSTPIHVINETKE